MKWWNLNSKVKILAAEASRILYFNVDAPIVITSSGRSGSTMLCRAVMNSCFCIKHKTSFSPKMVFYPAFQVGCDRIYRNGGVYKSHLLPGNIPSQVKTIFIYDDPVMTYKSFHRCVSIYGLEWGAKHLHNLESKHTINDIYEDVDYLNYEQQVTEWSSRNNGVFVRFSLLWSSTNVISEYLGVELKLPLKRQRASVINNEDDSNKTLRHLSGIYASLPPMICSH